MTFSSYEPEVASTDLVKLDEARQLVPADVIRHKILIQRYSWAYHSRLSSKPTMSKAPVMLCRRRGRVTACSRRAILLRKQSKGVLIGPPFFYFFVRRTEICVRPMSPFYVGSICLICTNSNLLKVPPPIHKTSRRINKNRFLELSSHDPSANFLWSL